MNTHIEQEDFYESHVVLLKEYEIINLRDKNSAIAWILMCEMLRYHFESDHEREKDNPQKAKCQSISSES